MQFSSLSLDDSGAEFDDIDLTTQKIEDSDTRLMEMLAAQAAHRDREGSGSEDEEALATSAQLSDDDKRDVLQKALSTLR